jgi:hypothetical protein
MEKRKMNAPKGMGWEAAAEIELDHAEAQSFYRSPGWEAAESRYLDRAKALYDANLTDTEGRKRIAALTWVTVAKGYLNSAQALYDAHPADLLGRALFRQQIEERLEWIEEESSEGLSGAV